MVCHQARLRAESPPAAAPGQGHALRAEPAALTCRGPQVVRHAEDHELLVRGLQDQVRCRARGQLADCVKPACASSVQRIAHISLG
jgi:hypothetical protein